jgi:transposase
MTRKLPSTVLPSSETKRWTARRKSVVLAAVSRGQLTAEEACHHYQLSEEEFSSWQRAFETDGVDGLRATRVRRYPKAFSSLQMQPTPSVATAREDDLSAAVAKNSIGADLGMTELPSLCDGTSAKM